MNHWLSGTIAIAVIMAPVVGGIPHAGASHVDAPLGRISCDELPLVSPTPLEMGDDERSMPYHALVRVLHFPSFSPADLAIEHIELRGAEKQHRVAPGEYLFEQIPIGYTTVGVYEPQAVPESPRGPTDPPFPAPPRRRAITVRNPLVLSRHALTVVDLFVVDDTDATTPLDFRGFVIDWESRQPLEGVVITCNKGSTTTAADGTFHFEEPMQWSDALAGTKVAKPGYRSFVLTGRSLIKPWVDHWKQNGTVRFMLASDAPAANKPRLPSLPR